MELKNFDKGYSPIPNVILFTIIPQGMLSLTEIRIVSYILRMSIGFSGNGPGRRRVWTGKMTKYALMKECGMKEGWCGQAIIQLLRRKILERSSRGGWRVNWDYSTWIPSESEGSLKPTIPSESEGNTVGIRRKYRRKPTDRKGFSPTSSRRSRPLNKGIKIDIKKGRRFDVLLGVIPPFLKTRAEKLTGEDPEKNPISTILLLKAKVSACPQRRPGCQGLKKGAPSYPVCYYCKNLKKSKRR